MLLVKPTELGPSLLILKRDVRPATSPQDDMSSKISPSFSIVILPPEPSPVSSGLAKEIGGMKKLFIQHVYVKMHQYAVKFFDKFRYFPIGHKLIRLYSITHAVSIQKIPLIIMQSLSSE